ncbi:MAG: hypothetical protein ACRDD8_12925 [Bacteroidales bacterium]
MKFNRNFALIALGATMLLGSCQSDNNTNVDFTPSKQVEEAFLKQFPNAKNITWREQKGYTIASFILDQKTKVKKDYNEAWFKHDGTCALTEIEIDNFESLPLDVQNGYEATIFFTEGWTIDDIDLLYRPGIEPVYKIEVEKQGQPDHDLKFAEDGRLLSVMVDNDDDNDDDDNVPVEIPSAIINFLDKNAGNYTILDFEIEKNTLEVEIRVNNREFELYFEQNSYHFLYSQSEIRVMDLPAEVRHTINTQFSEYEIDDCYLVEYPDHSIAYKVEMENDATDKEITVLFHEDGTIIK